MHVCIWSMDDIPIFMINLNLSAYLAGRCSAAFGLQDDRNFIAIVEAAPWQISLGRVPR